MRRSDGLSSPARAAPDAAWKGLRSCTTAARLRPEGSSGIAARSAEAAQDALIRPSTGVASVRRALYGETQVARRAKAPAEAMEPQDSSSPGAFFVVRQEETRCRSWSAGTTSRTATRRCRRPRGGRVGGRDERRDGRPEVLRPARHVAAHDAAACARSTSRRSTRASASTAPRSAAGRGSRESDMLLMPQADDGDPRPGDRGADALARLRDRSTRSRASRTRRTRAASRAAPRSTSARRASPTPPTSGPSASSSSSTRSATSSARTASHYCGRLAPRATGTPASRASATRAAPKEGYFPPAPHDTLHDLRTRDGADARAARDPVRVPPPRGRVRRPVRDRPALPDADPHGRPGA